MVVLLWGLYMKKVGLVIAVVLLCAQDLFCADESGEVPLDDRSLALFVLGQELMSNPNINSAVGSNVSFIPNDREWDLINGFLDCYGHGKTEGNMVAACEHAICEFQKRTNAPGEKNKG